MSRWGSRRWGVGASGQGSGCQGRGRGRAGAGAGVKERERRGRGRGWHHAGSQHRLALHVETWRASCPLMLSTVRARQRHRTVQTSSTFVWLVVWRPLAGEKGSTCSRRALSRSGAAIEREGATSRPRSTGFHAHQALHATADQLQPSGGASCIIFGPSSYPPPPKKKDTACTHVHKHARRLSL